MKTEDGIFLVDGLRRVIDDLTGVSGLLFAVHECMRRECLQAEHLRILSEQVESCVAELSEMKDMINSSLTGKINPPHYDPDDRPGTL